MNDLPTSSLSLEEVLVRLHLSANPFLWDVADRIEQLRKALRRYGKHETSCPRYGLIVVGNEADCTCGLVEFLKEKP